MIITVKPIIDVRVDQLSCLYDSRGFFFIVCSLDLQYRIYVENNEEKLFFGRSNFEKISQVSHGF
jgi:hypothetical protein